MKKAANCMSLAAFVMRSGGAGGIWTPVRKPFSGRSTCLAVWFESYPLCRAVARYTGRQHPIVLPRVKVPSPEPADEIIFTAGSL